MPVNALIDFLRLVFPTLEMLGDAHPELTLESPADLLAVLQACVERLPDENERSLGRMHLRDLQRLLAQGQV